MGHPRFSYDEIRRIGKEIYDKQVGPIVETKENIGKSLSIDIETGEYEFGGELLDSTHRLLKRFPDAAVYNVRIGFNDGRLMGRAHPSAVPLRIPDDQIVPRGKKLYETQIGPIVETEENIGRLISIDVETGEYEIGDETLEPGLRILHRRPDAILYGARIGYDAVMGIGGGEIHRTTPLMRRLE